MARKAGPAKEKIDDLAKYNAMRDFKKTKEPAGKQAGAGPAKPGAQPIYVVQKHAATRLHWDFRLELHGVLKSWAVTNEPVADPSIKRLAVRTEDHPISYATFAGDIPKGEYGGGHVEIWDHDTWQPHEDPDAALARGKLGFTLSGGRMAGDWALVKLKRDKTGGKRENWLLIKENEDGKAARLNPGAAAASAAAAPQAKAVAKPKGGLAKSGPAWVKAVTAGGPKKLATIDYKPALATRVETVPVGDDWLHELKFDGYRALLYIKKGKVQIVTRNGLDWTHRFPKLETALQQLKADEAAIDGEIVVMDAKGRTDFGLLQMVLGGEAEVPFTFMAFDLLKLDGKDLKQQPLLARKAALAKLIGTLDRKNKKSGVIRFSEHVIGQGDKFFAEAKKLKAEGIISKRADSFYSGARTHDWLKIKAGQRQEFVIGGFTRRSDNRNAIGALLVGVFDKKEFVYSGRIGTGFAGPVSDDIMARAQSLIAKESPFTKGAKPEARGVTWLQPKLVGEVEFAELTREGVVRHGAFKGLREDKGARQVTLELPEEKLAKAAPKIERKPAPKQAAGDKAGARPGALVLHGITISHPDRVVFPEDGYTKGDIARYYADNADRILEDLAGRPLSIMRCSDNSHACFFQRHIQHGTSVRQLGISDSKSGEPYFAIATTKDLLSLVQLNVLEFHAWNTKRAPYAKPDRLIFDLDPDPNVGWPSVKAAAQTVRERLQELGLESWAKTTGGKGIHLVVPLQQAPGWDETKAFCRAFAEKMAADYPDAFTSNPLKVKRKNKIYLDYLRNDNTATAVSAYTLRARAGAPVSMPVTWQELAKLPKPDFYNIQNAAKRFAKGYKDPWAGMNAARQSLTKTVIKALAKS